MELLDDPSTAWHLWGQLVRGMELSKFFVMIPNLTGISNRKTGHRKYELIV